MPTREVDRQTQGLGAAAKEVAEHGSAILRLELELKVRKPEEQRGGTEDRCGGRPYS